MIEPVIRAMIRASVVFPAYLLSITVDDYGTAECHQNQVVPTRQTAYISKARDPAGGFLQE